METRWSAKKMRAGDWAPVQWFNSNLAHAADEINRLPNLVAVGRICPVNYMGQSFRSTFSYQTNGGGEGNSFCTIAENIMQTMFAKPETEAMPKSGKERHAKTAWEKATRFLIPARFSTTSSRLLAIYSDKPAIGSAYYAMAAQTPEQEKAFAAFMNSSFGIIQMLNRRTKKLTYPAYEVGHIKTLMFPDPTTADLAPLLRAFESVKDAPLQRLSMCAQDPARKTLDHAAARALSIDPAVTDQWREWLSREPTISGKPAPA